jgi:uncharacterized membrane protein
LPELPSSWHDAPALEDQPMSVNEPTPPQPPTMSDKQLVLVVYILYLVSYVTGFTSLVGVIIAHVQIGSADPVLASHYRFQIRTFWIGLLYLFVGIILTFALVGILVLIWWFVWSLVRNVKGLLAMNENKPIADPASWMFG